MNNALPLLALSMGLINSFHCVGMCGPVAMALPVRGASKARRALILALYNLGRAVTYALLGLVAGSFGLALSQTAGLHYLPVFAGVLILLFVLWPTWLEGKLQQFKWTRNALAHVRERMRTLLKSQHLGAAFTLGVLNGMLPCGMVYLALASSLATGSALGGAAFMFLFGAGTMPLMLAVGFAVHSITPAMRTYMRRATPFLLSLAGLWLIGRGLNVHLPVHGKAPQQIPVCRVADQH